MNERMARSRREAELLLGDGREDAPLEADHGAHERIHDDQQRELPEVLPEPQLDWRHRGRPSGHVRASAPMPVRTRPPLACHSTTPCSRRWARKPLLRRISTASSAMTQYGPRQYATTSRSFGRSRTRFVSSRKGHRDRTGDMAGFELLAWAYVDDGDGAVLHATQELAIVDRLQSPALHEVVLADTIDLGKARVRQRPQLKDERDHERIRQPIRDVRCRPSPPRPGRSCATPGGGATCWRHSGRSGGQSPRPSEVLGSAGRGPRGAPGSTPPSRCGQSARRWRS